MEDLARLRELRSLVDNELLSQEEFDSRKMALVTRLLENASEVAASLQADPSKAVKVTPKPQGEGDEGPPQRPAVKKVLVDRKPLSRLSQNARKGPALVRSFTSGPLEARSCLMEQAKSEEDRILAWCRSNGSKYRDDSFGQDNRSIAKSDRSKLLKNVHHWERLTERSASPSLFVGGSGSGDVIQGEVGDCWFLGALAMCATRQDDLLYPLFVSAHPEQGFFQIRFYIDAAWRVVTVDDYVPVKESGSMIFGHCKDDDEYWVALVEKAFAKLNSCYEHIGSGNFSEAMSSLTGEGSEAFELTPQMSDSDDMWGKLEYFVEEAFLMGCSIEGKGEHDNGMGLLTGHAYGIIGCRTVTVKKQRVRLLHVFNPWGQKEWRGAWSDDSKEWTPELMRELGQTDEDDGMFWICYEDFMSNFNMFSVCRLLTDDVGKVWQKTVFAGEWDEATAGGCCNFASWIKNPQYWLTVHADTQMFFHLARQDGRIAGRPTFDEAIGCYIFEERDLTKRKVHRFPNDIFGGKQPLFIGSREYSFSATMPSGNYILMPCTFDPGQHLRFFLSVYSEDPTVSGEIGYGPSQPADIVRVDVTAIAALNRPGEESEEEQQPSPPPPVKKPAEKSAPENAADAEPRCCVCHKSTKGSKSFRMGGERYHASCFACSACDQLLDPSDFYQDDQGRAVCQDCHEE